MANREIEAILRVSSKLGSMTALKTLESKLAAVNRQAEAFNRTSRFSALSTSVGRVRSEMMMLGRYVAPAALAYGAVQAMRSYAQVEQQIARIGITADATQAQTAAAMGKLQSVARDLHAPFDDVVGGMESLVASGKSLDEAFAFLPSVGKAAVASGADMNDMATTADALSTSLGITAGEMERAFDDLAFSGKMGKFELRDMAAELPSLTPAFAALGYRGPEALRKLAVTLQAVRKETGTSGEAATALQNVFQKMFSNDTEKKFKEFGIDLRKRLKDATDQGEDLLDAFTDLAVEATRGDLSQLPKLFTDAQFLQGVRALINQRSQAAEWQAAMSGAAGTVQRDFDRMSKTTQATLTDLSNSWDAFVTKMGGKVAEVAVPALDYVNDQVDQEEALLKGLDKSGMTDDEKRKWLEQNSGLNKDSGARRNMMRLGGWQSDEEKETVNRVRQEMEKIRAEREREQPEFPDLPIDGPIPGNRKGSIVIAEKPLPRRAVDKADMPIIGPIPQSRASAIEADFDSVRAGPNVPSGTPNEGEKIQALIVAGKRAVTLYEKAKAAIAGMPALPDLAEIPPPTKYDIQTAISMPPQAAEVETTLPEMLADAVSDFGSAVDRFVGIMPELPLPPDERPGRSISDRAADANAGGSGLADMLARLDADLAESGERAGQAIGDAGTRAGDAVRDGGSGAADAIRQAMIEGARQAGAEIARQIASGAANIKVNVNAPGGGGIAPASGNKGQTMVGAGKTPLNRGQL